MKNCPFCAEEIQTAAIKCKHCGEFLEGSGLSPKVAEPTPWYLRKTSIIVALSIVGPLALPLIWLRPQTSLAWKIGLTVVVLVLSWLLYLATLEALQLLQETLRTLSVG